MSDHALLKHAACLARAFAQALRDMRGLDYRADEADRRLRPAGQAVPPGSLRVAIRFTGSARGEYGLSLRPETAALLAGCWKPEQGPAALAAAREEYEGFVKEALNAAVGEAIQTLDEGAGLRGSGPSRFEPAGAAPDAPLAAALGEVPVIGAQGPVACNFTIL